MMRDHSLMILSEMVLGVVPTCKTTMDTPSTKQRCSRPLEPARTASNTNVNTGTAHETDQVALQSALLLLMWWWLPSGWRWAYFGCCRRRSDAHCRCIPPLDEHLLDEVSNCPADADA